MTDYSNMTGVIKDLDENPVIKGNYDNTNENTTSKISTV